MAIVDDIVTNNLLPPEWKCDRCGYGEYIHRGDETYSVQRAVQHERSCAFQHSDAPNVAAECDELRERLALVTAEVDAEKRAREVEVEHWVGRYRRVDDWRIQTRIQMLKNRQILDDVLDDLKGLYNALVLDFAAAPEFLVREVGKVARQTVDDILTTAERERKS